MATDMLHTSHPHSDASTANGNVRIDILAKPKAFAAKYQDDRRSIYWVDYEPPRPGPNGVTAIVASPRVKELAHHKDFHKAPWQWNRETPVWPVSRKAQTAHASERIAELGQPKHLHPDYQMDRSPYMKTTSGARFASASPRIEYLAIPKKRVNQFEAYESEWGEYFHVPATALKGRATERLEKLAEHKNYPKEFKGEKPVQWPVSESALKSIASLRLQQLSRPLSRALIRDDYDPYKVSSAARKARVTPRLELLSAPIPRKVKQKKII